MKIYFISLIFFIINILYSFVLSTEEYPYFNNESPTKFFIGNKKFTDETFTFEKAFGTNKNKTFGGVPLENIVFKRPEEIFGTFRLFENKIECSDNIQGALANCYFISTLCALAKYESTILSIFKKINIKNGYYEILMKVNNTKTIVIVDDLLPVSKLNEKNIFSQTDKNEIWTMIIEKAWAKVKGGYAQSESGDPSDVISAFTNFKIEVHNIDDTSEANIRKEFYNGNFIIFGSHQNKTSISNQEISESHAYNLINIKNDNIIVRNPWGKIKIGKIYNKESKGETTIPLKEIKNNFQEYFLGIVDENTKKKSNSLKLTFPSINKKDKVIGKINSKLSQFPEIKEILLEMINKIRLNEFPDSEFKILKHSDGTLDYCGFGVIDGNTLIPEGIGIRVFDSSKYSYGTFKKGVLVDGWFINISTNIKYVVKNGKRKTYP